MSATPGTGPNLRGLALVVLVTALITAAGAGSYLATTQAQPKQSVQVGGVFHLTLMEIMNSEWNSSIAQPTFYVMGSNGLESSSNIVVPAKTLIELTIVAYDTPTEGSDDSMGKVSGTVGGNMFLINGTTASMGDMPEQWGQNVTSVPGSMIAHTFTIQQLGINVPVVGGDTQIAYLFFDKAGTFTWLCLPPCGFGPNGADGAMSTSGWMTGQITVR